MSGAGRDFVGHHLDYHLGLEPHIGDEDRIHTRRPLFNLQLVSALPDLPPFGVRQAGAKLRNGCKPVVFRVVDACQQRADAELRALAFSKVVAEQDEVDRVIELTAGVALKLHPVEVARASLVFRFRSLDDDPLQPLADRVQQRLGEDLDRVGLDDWRGQQHCRARNHLVDEREPLLVRQLGEVATVAVEDVEDESHQWQFSRGLLDAVLPPAARGQLKREVFLQLLAVCDRLAVQDESLVLQSSSCRGEFREHHRVVLEVARKDAHHRAVFVDLYPDPIVLRLDRHQSKLLDHGLRVGEPLGELAADRPTDRNLERIDVVFPARPEGLRDQPQVGRSVVSAFQHRPEGAVTLPGKRQCVKHGGVSDAEPQATECDAHEVLGGVGIDLFQQGREQRAFLFDRSGTGGTGDFQQSCMHLTDRQFRARPMRRELGRHQPQIAEPAEEFRDLVGRRGEGLTDGRDDQLLTEADLDRFEEGNQSPLDQIGQRLDLDRRALQVKLSERLHELVPAAGRLQPVEVGAQLRDGHSCSSSRSMNNRCAGTSLRRAESRSNQSARSTSGNRCILCERGGHSTSNVLLVRLVTSRSPTVAHAWTTLPPA